MKHQALPDLENPEWLLGVILAGKAWKGKASTGITFTALNSECDVIPQVTIDGGPECQWEVNELKFRICPSFSHLRLELMQFHTTGSKSNKIGCLARWAQMGEE